MFNLNDEQQEIGKTTDEGEERPGDFLFRKDFKGRVMYKYVFHGEHERGGVFMEHPETKEQVAVNIETFKEYQN